MIATLMALGLLAGDAHAGGSPKLIRYDSYADDDDFIFGAFFDGFPGLGKKSCMAQVYSFDDADFPLVPTELRMFWAGEGAGDASEVLLKIYFYHYEGLAADRWILAEGQYRLLDQEEVLLDGISLEGTWVDLNLANNGFDFDGDVDQEGKQPITYGSIVANVCYENEQTMPAIAMDTDGYKPEPVPENDEDILEGQETSQFRSLIYWNGLWTDSHTFLINNFGFDQGGDFIMRLVVEAQWEEDDEEILGDLVLFSVQPQSQEAGRSEVMLVTGDGIDANAEAFVGSVALTDVMVRDTSIQQEDGIVEPGRALNGYTSPDLEPGDYDVTVRNPDGAEFVLEDSFTVVEAEGGCDCATAQPSRLAWWLPLMGLGIALRRRRSPDTKQ